MPSTSQIPDGKLMVLVGPSGCGKTTVLRMVAGLEDLTGGRILIGGRVVNEVPPGDRDVAMVFQNYALYPHMTVYQNMALSLKIHKVGRDEMNRQGPGGGGDPPPRGTAREAPARALGRAASAGRDGAGDRSRAAGLPHGRAVVEP